MSEIKKGKVVFVQQMVQNGQPDKFNEFFKYNVSLDNGDMGIMYSKQSTNPVSINQEIEYEKKVGQSSKGPYTTIKLVQENKGGYGKFDKKYNNIAVKCAELAAGIAVSKDVDMTLNNFKKAFTTINAIVNGGDEKPQSEKPVMDEATFLYVKTLFLKYKNEVAEPDKILVEIVTLLSRYEIPLNIIK